MQFGLTIDGDKRVIAKLDKAIATIGNARQPLTDTGTLVVSEIDKQFSTEGTRLTGAWQPLTAGTLAQKTRLGYGMKGILERTGKLKNSFSKVVDRFKVTVASKGVDYYKYHQIGMGRNPKRTMLTLNNENLKQNIIEVFRKFVKSALS